MCRPVLVCVLIYFLLYSVHFVMCFCHYVQAQINDYKWNARERCQQSAHSISFLMHLSTIYSRSHNTRRPQSSSFDSIWARANTNHFCTKAQWNEVAMQQHIVNTFRFEYCVWPFASLCWRCHSRENHHEWAYESMGALPFICVCVSNGLSCFTHALFITHSCSVLMYKLNARWEFHRSFIL